MYRHGSIEDYGQLRLTARKITGFEFKFEFHSDTPINTDDTYFMIFGPEQDEYQGPVINAINAAGGVVLYKSPRAINFGYDDEPRNTLIVFEFNAVSV